MARVGDADAVLFYRDGCIAKIAAEERGRPPDVGAPQATKAETMTAAPRRATKEVLTSCRHAVRADSLGPIGVLSA
jgi:hypothetical protein